MNALAAVGLFYLHRLWVLESIMVASEPGVIGRS
jgi:hypothetical protein